jgi:hypothetical protein
MDTFLYHFQKKSIIINMWETLKEFKMEIFSHFKFLSVIFI